MFKLMNVYIPRIIIYTLIVREGRYLTDGKGVGYGLLAVWITATAEIAEITQIAVAPETLDAGPGYSDGAARSRGSGCVSCRTELSCAGLGGRRSLTNDVLRMHQEDQTH